MKKAALAHVPVILGLAIASIITADNVAYGQVSKDSFPTRPARIIVPFAPGGSNDMLARYVGQKLTERLGQQFVVDNRVGADGRIGTDMAARAVPDGYTLLLVSTTFTTNTAVHKLPYDPVRSFAPISLIGAGPNALATAPAFPAKSVKDLIALAKAEPGKLRYASPGVGAVNHFGGELFKLLAGVDIVHIPYKGGAPAMFDVMSGQVEMMFVALIQVIPQMALGKLKVLGIGGSKRNQLLPDVPTIAEAGVPGYDGTIWWGVVAPAGVPRPIVTKLNSEITEILRQPETAKRLNAEAAEPLIETAEGFGRLIAKDVEKWTKIAKAAGIRAE